MTTSAEPHTGTIYGLGQSIATVPYQLGYRPTASLVVLCMAPASPVKRGSGLMRGSVTLIARVDLVPPPGQSHPEAGLEPALLRSDVASVVALAFEDGGDGEIDATPILARLTDVAASHAVAVVASARVRDRQFAAIDAAGRTGAWEGLPDSGDVPVIAEYVMAGRAPVHDRASLASVLTPADQAFAVAVAKHMDVAAMSARATARMISVVITDPNCRPVNLEPREVATVASSLHNLDVRDAVLSRLSLPLSQPRGLNNKAERHVACELNVCDRVDGPACFRLAALASYIPRPKAAPTLTLVGYLAWQAGEGALANIAIGAALEVDPDYSLARLVDVALSSALRPPPPV